MKPLLSIIVPTKDRYETLFPVIDALLKYIVGNNYEIIIQDNSVLNEPAILKFSEINSPKIKYFHSNELLSVPENFNLAISNSYGDYLIVIGDDDLVSPYILDIVNIMQIKNIESLIFNKGNYYWNNLTFKKEYAFNYPASLQYAKNISINPIVLNTQNELEFVLEKGGSNNFNLPSLYHGIVKKEVMYKVKNNFGSFVPGSSPDMAMSIALTFVLKEHYYINYPVSITGAAKKSAAGLGVKGQHYGELDKIPWLPKNILENWNPKIPKIWSVNTIFVQSIYEVFKVNNSELNLNYKFMYSQFFINEKAHRCLIIPYINKITTSNKEKYTLLFYLNLKTIIKELIWNSPSFILNTLIFLRGDFKKKILVRPINNVDECLKYLSINTKIV